MALRCSSSVGNEASRPGAGVISSWQKCFKILYVQIYILSHQLKFSHSYSLYIIIWPAYFFVECQGFRII